MDDRLDKLTPAEADDLTRTFAFALQFDGRKRFRFGDEFMARITARHLVEHLRQSGYVVMKEPPLEGHSQIMRPPGDAP